MRTVTKLAAFAAVLALVGGLAAVAGGAIEPGRIGGEESTSEDHGSDEMTAVNEEHGSSTEEDGATEEAAEAPAGLPPGESGYRLQLTDPVVPGRDREELRFRILEEDGQPVTRFDEELGRRMHLILVRRDLSGYRHLHPELAADGTWSHAELPTADRYRAFLQFRHEGAVQTVAFTEEVGR